jgi:helix-turn-helix protein
MIAFIDGHKDRFGVEPICRVLPIAPATYYDAMRRPASARTVRDGELKTEIARVHAEHFGVYGARKVWRQLHREGIAVARCTVERLMGELHLEGVRRGKGRRTTTTEAAAARPAELVERDFSASRPTSCGSPTSPMWPPGPGSSMWPWSSTRSPGFSWAGRPPGRYASTWPWTPWRWPSGIAAMGWMAWCPLGPRQPIPVHPL